jgi:hypothetical protein
MPDPENDPSLSRAAMLGCDVWPDLRRELARVEDDRLRREVIDAIRPRLGLSALINGVTMATCVLVIGLVVSALTPGNLVVPEWLLVVMATFVGTFLSGAVCAFAFRRSAARRLREILNQRGMPTCMRCGYDLRAASDPRCPECGQPTRERDLT